MKKKFIISYLLLVIISFLFLPFSYGSWSESVYINGYIKTAEAEAGSEDELSSEASKNTYINSAKQNQFEPQDELDLTLENDFKENPELTDDSAIPEDENKAETGMESSTPPELTQDMDEEVNSENSVAAPDEPDAGSEDVNRYGDEEQWSETDVEKSGT